ncbi:MAG: hypothetical protein ABIY39_07130, partial [Sphingomonas sp.]
DPRVRDAQFDWESVARFVVSAFRADAARAGASAEVEPLVAELCRLSPDFDAMWRANDVRTYGDGVKHLRHPILGPIAFEYSSFAVDGRPDLSMVVYNPATSEDGERVRSLLREWPAGATIIGDGDTGEILVENALRDQLAPRPTSQAMRN